MGQYGVGLASIFWCQILPDSQFPALPSGTGFDIEGTLSQWMEQNVIPNPSAANNLLYVFIAAPGMGPSAISGNHGPWTNSAGDTFFFAQCLTPPVPAPGTDPFQWWTNQQAAGTYYTLMLSHELWEAFTDPSFPNGWTDDGSECCDIFENLGLPDVFCSRWQTECYWSNADNQCIAGFSNDWVSIAAPPLDPTIGHPMVCYGPSAGINANGTIEVFTFTNTGDVWHCLQEGQNQNYGAWAPLIQGNGITPGAFTVATNSDGRLEIFAFQNGNLWHAYQNEQNDAWSGGESLGAPAEGIEIYGSIAVGRNQDGELEAFVLGWDGNIHHIRQLGPWAGWSGWGDSLGSPPPGLAIGTEVLPDIPVVVSNLMVGSNEDGRLEIFVQAADNTFWHKWQTAPNNGWSDWQGLQGSGSAFLGRNNDGRLELFATDVNEYQHIWQIAPRGVERLEPPCPIPGSGWGGLTIAQRRRGSV